MEFALCGVFRNSGAKSRIQVARLMRLLFIITITAVVLYMVMYNFYVITPRNARKETPQNSSLGRTRQFQFSSKYVETAMDTSAGDMNRSLDNFGLNLKKVWDNITNMTKDIEEVKDTLKQINNKSTTKDKSMEINYPKNQKGKPTSLLTIFSTWNRNEGKYRVHNNTLKNWVSFKPVFNPVLFSNDSVLAQEALKYGWMVLPLTKTGENGLPVLKYMYIDAIRSFDSTFYCYANSDILFDDGLVHTLVHLVYKLDNDILSLKPMFMTGLRWNVINVLGNEISPRKNLKALIESRGKVFSTSAEDYFITNGIYPWHDIPEIVVGAIAYDNWLVFNARDKKHLTINTSRTVTAVHQSLDRFNHRSHIRDTVNYNANLLMDMYKIRLPYHRGFIDCIEKFTDFVNDTFVLGDRMCITSVDTMDYKGIRFKIGTDGIALITMCNGENKFTMDFVRTWHQVLDDIERNEDITGLITIGEGRSFSTGLDISWLKTQSPATLDEYHHELHELYKRILSLGLTTVAVINGHAIAEGAFIALMHDYRIMREDKGWINWPEVHMKLPFTKTMLDLFRIKVQNGAALREALVFGKRLDAVSAKSLGIIDVATTEENLLAEAKRTLTNAVGKLSLTRGFFNDMKSDIYNSYVVQEKLGGKLIGRL